MRVREIDPSMTEAKLKEDNTTNRAEWRKTIKPTVSIRVVDAFDARVEAETGGRVTELLHAIVEMLRMMFVLRILVTRVLSGTIHPVTQSLERSTR